MSYIEFKNVGKKFGGKALFEGLSFSVKKKEIVNICGPTGCGKSVILKLLSGVEKADSGEICINGVNVLEQNFRERNLGVVFQQFSLYPHFTCFENIASPLRAKRLPKAEIRDRVERTARLLKIDQVLSHLPKEMSNGQKQRTALARALVKEPAILFFDDPLKNVDAKLSYEMRLEIPHILSAFGCTALYITQDFKEAMALGDRILVLMDGRVMQLDTPQKIYKEPINLRVAKFFGDPTINHFTIPAPTVKKGAVTIDIFKQKLIFPKLSLPQMKEEVVMGVRPEHVELSAKSLGKHASVPMQILSCTPLNVRFIFLLKSPQGDEIFASVPEYIGQTFRDLKKIYVSFNGAALYFFNAETGERIPLSSKPSRSLKSSKSSKSTKSSNPSNPTNPTKRTRKT